MKTAITTSPWLGTQQDRWDRERFPQGTLNEAQIRTLFNIREGARLVVGLDLKPAILKLTDEIVEVHTVFGHPGRSFGGEPTYFWLDVNGDVLSSVIEKYEGPHGVHKPGDTFRKWAVGYLRTPDMDRYDKAKEVEYEHMWSIGNYGAVAEVREHIRKYWIEQDNSSD